MVNATEMAKAFEKRIDVFLKTDHAKEFISELELTPFGGSLEPLKKEEIIKTINGVNTWMHRILALKFAAWLQFCTQKFIEAFCSTENIQLGSEFLPTRKLVKLSSPPCTRHFLFILLNRQRIFEIMK